MLLLQQLKRNQLNNKRKVSEDNKGPGSDPGTFFIGSLNMDGPRFYYFNSVSFCIFFQEKKISHRPNRGTTIIYIIYT